MHEVEDIQEEMGVLDVVDNISKQIHCRDVGIVGSLETCNSNAKRRKMILEMAS